MPPISAPAPAPAVLHFLTARLNDKESTDIRKMIPRRDLAEAWRDLEDHAKELSKRLSGKEAAKLSIPATGEQLLMRMTEYEKLAPAQSEMQAIAK